MSPEISPPAGGLRRFAPAKVNLFLHVLGRRADGYHEIESWVTFVDVGDELVAVDWLRSCRNDLEEPARELAPEVREALAALSGREGCLLARMPGSGSTCFGVFAQRESAARAAEKLGAAYPGWWIQVASGL